MEYIPGATLEFLWNVLGKDGHARVAEHLKSYFDALSQIPFPSSSSSCSQKKFYCGKLGARPYDDIFLGSTNLPCGPFSTEKMISMRPFTDGTSPSIQSWHQAEVSSTEIVYSRRSCVVTSQSLHMGICRRRVFSSGPRMDCRC